MQFVYTATWVIPMSRNREDHAFFGTYTTVDGQDPGPCCDHKHPIYTQVLQHHTHPNRCHQQ